MIDTGSGTGRDGDACCHPTRIVGQVTGLVASSVLNHWHYVGVGIWPQTISRVPHKRPRTGRRVRRRRASLVMSPPDHAADLQEVGRN